LPLRVGGRLGLAIAGEDTLLVSADPTWIPEGLVVKSKFHMCSPTTASMRLNPDGSCPGIRPGIPRYRAPGYDRVQAGKGVGADRGGR